MSYADALSMAFRWTPPIELRCGFTGFSGGHEIEFLSRSDGPILVGCRLCREVIGIPTEVFGVAMTKGELLELVSERIAEMSARHWNQDWGSTNPDESEAW